MLSPLVPEPYTDGEEIMTSGLLKKSIGLLVLVGLAVAGGIRIHEKLWPKRETLAEQSWRCQQQMHQDLILFHIDQYAPDLIVVHKGQFHEKTKEVWGDTYFDDGGTHIEIMSIDDMPPYWTTDGKLTFQRRIVQHEVLHIVLTAMGMPDEFQDPIILRLEPEMKKP